MHQADAAVATHTLHQWVAGQPARRPAPMRYLFPNALRLWLARTVSVRFLCWGSAEEVRRATGVALGSTTGATGAAPAARRRMWLQVAWAGSAARGSNRSRRQQWLHPTRGRPDMLRRPPMLMLYVAVGTTPPSRRREETSSPIQLSPSRESSGKGEAGRRTREEHLAGGGELVPWTGARIVVRIVAAASPSSDGPPLPLSPPPVSLGLHIASTTPPSATATRGTRGKEPPERAGAGESDGWMTMAAAAITVPVPTGRGIMVAVILVTAVAMPAMRMRVMRGAGADAMAVTATAADARQGL